MKRLPELDFIRIEGLEDDDPVGQRVIREELPPYWLLGELMFHTVHLCADAYGSVSARMLLDAALSAPRGADLKAAVEPDTFFKRTYTISYHKNEDILYKSIEAVPEEERGAWDNGIEGADAYLEWRDKTLPHYKVLLDGGNFFIGDYRHLPDDLRAVIDNAFSGFVFNALNGPDFASLCKTKNPGAAMTFEQKLDEPLDHEALYHRLLAQLGHA